MSRTPHAQTARRILPVKMSIKTLAEIAIIYARVSSKDQESDGFSIPSQLKLLRDYALTQGFHVVREFVDVETAKAAGRKQFEEMLRFCQSQKQVPLLLVEKTDRLYRNFTDYVKLEELGVVVHLVKEHEILSKDSRSHAKFIHGIKVLMAKNFIDNLSEEVRKGQAEKIEQGEYPAKAPIGYRNNTSTHLVEVDPVKSKFAVAIFKLASEEWSLEKIRKEMHRKGLLNLSPKIRLSKSHVRRILMNPFYTGSFQWNGKLYRGIHTPLVSKELYDTVQGILQNRHKPKYRKNNFAYGGLLFCAKCGCAVTSEIKKGRYIYYHCTQSRSVCDAGYYREEDLDPQFDAIVKSITIPPSIRDWMISAIKKNQQETTTDQETDLGHLKTERQRLDHRLEQMYLDKLDGKVSEEFWREKSDQWTQEKKQILAKIEGSSKPDAKVYLEGFRLLELASRAYDLYKRQDPAGKNKFLKILLSNSTLEGGSVRPAYKKPFDILARGVKSEVWGE